MITTGETKLAITNIIRRKREKNRAEINQGHEPRLMLAATFGEIQKEIEKIHGRPDVAPQELEATLKDLISSGWLRPVSNAFVPRKQLLKESETITESWKKQITQ